MDQRWCASALVCASRLDSYRTTLALMVCGLSAFVRFIRMTEYFQTAQQHSRRGRPDLDWQTDTELHFGVGHLAQPHSTLETEGCWSGSWVRQGSSDVRGCVLDRKTPCRPREGSTERWAVATQNEPAGGNAGSDSLTADQTVSIASEVKLFSIIH